MKRKDTTHILMMDSRKRICLSKFFDVDNVKSVCAYRKNDQIILEPLVEIPAREAWLYKNKETFGKVKQGLAQQGSVRRGLFAKYADHDV